MWIRNLRVLKFTFSQTTLKLAVSRTSEPSPCSGKACQLTQLRVSSTHVDWSFGSLYTPYRRLLPADRRTTAPKAPAPHSMTGLMFFYQDRICKWFDFRLKGIGSQLWVPSWQKLHGWSSHLSLQAFCGLPVVVAQRILWCFESFMVKHNPNQ